MSKYSARRPVEHVSLTPTY